MKADTVTDDVRSRATGSAARSAARSTRSRGDLELGWSLERLLGTILRRVVVVLRSQRNGQKGLANEGKSDAPTRRSAFPPQPSDIQAVHVWCFGHG